MKTKLIMQMRFDAGHILTINDTEREIRNVIDDVSPPNDDTAPMNTSPQPNSDPIPVETTSSEKNSKTLRSIMMHRGSIRKSWRKCRIIQI